MDPKEEAARAGAKAMFEAGKGAARRLYDDVVLTDEEKAERAAKKAAAQKKRRWKWIALGVAALVAAILVASYWQYVLGALVVGAALYAGYYFARKKLSGGKGESKDEGEASAKESDEALAAKVAAKRKVAREGKAAPKVKARVEAEEIVAAPKALPEEVDPKVRARVAAEKEQQIDDELAELKRRAGK